MREYENYSREELIQRIKELETNLSQSARNDAEIEEMSENLAKQRKINFLSILMNTILSNVFVAISVKDISMGLSTSTLIRLQRILPGSMHPMY